MEAPAAARWPRRGRGSGEQVHGLGEGEAAEAHHEVYGVAGLSGVGTGPVVLLDDDGGVEPEDLEVAFGQAGEINLQLAAWPERILGALIFQILLALSPAIE